MNSTNIYNVTLNNALKTNYHLKGHRVYQENVQYLYMYKYIYIYIYTYIYTCTHTHIYTTLFGRRIGIVCGNQVNSISLMG